MRWQLAIHNAARDTSMIVVHVEWRVTGIGVVSHMLNMTNNCSDRAAHNRCTGRSQAGQLARNAVLLHSECESQVAYQMQ
jgi:hypothetical protein